MAILRVRTGGVELEVPDEAALFELQAGGLLGADAELEEDGVWRPLSPPPAPPAPALKAGDDPWSAWNDVDASKVEEIYETYVHREDDAAELPGAAVRPMPKPIIASRPASPPPLPEVSRDTVAPAGSPPPLPPPAEPAVWEASRPPSAAAQTEFHPTPSFSPPPSRSESPARPPVPSNPPLIRPLHLAGMVLTGLLVIGGGMAALEMMNPETPNIVAVSGAQIPPAAPVEPPPDVLAEVEAKLRAVGLGEPHGVSRDGDLGDAILIDLQKLRLDVERVDAPVTKWLGRKNDDPDQAEVHVIFHTSGELEHELGAIALVVGRYKRRYTIDIPVVEAIWRNGEQHMARELDAKKAELFFEGRLTLGQVLAIE